METLDLILIKLKWVLGYPKNEVTVKLNDAYKILFVVIRLLEDIFVQVYIFLARGILLIDKVDSLHVRNLESLVELKGFRKTSLMSLNAILTWEVNYHYGTFV